MPFQLQQSRPVQRRAKHGWLLSSTAMERACSACLLYTADTDLKIAEEEVAHVAVGVYWFAKVCERMGRIPCATFKDMLKEYNVEVKGPFNLSARDEAGIPRDWYAGSSTPEDKSELSEVHDRLTCIVAIERENSSMNGLP